MSGDHHKESHEEQKTQNSMIDKLFNDLLNYMTKSISTFVAFLFMLITVGAVIGYVIGIRREDEWLIMAPAIIGLIAYYNRAFAIVIFAILILLVFWVL
ncbi:MAG: hypothetical protein QXZ13_02895 [Candidatus Diapherotrites archaeon]